MNILNHSAYRQASPEIGRDICAFHFTDSEQSFWINHRHGPWPFNQEDLTMLYANRSAAVSAAAAFLAVTGLAAPASADGLEFAAEVDSCLAAVNNRVDLKDANRVRHLVTDSKRTGIGYALTIETSVFSADHEKRYAVYCLARGSSEPLKLTIDDVDS